MLQKIKKLDEVLNKLDEADKKSFVFENFNHLNLQIESILTDIKSNELNNSTNVISQEHITIFRNLLNKIDNLESKILPKANLLVSFSKSNL